jgi:hypothetical protein
MGLKDLKAFRFSHRFDIFPLILPSAPSLCIGGGCTSEWYSSSPRLNLSYNPLGEVVMTSACLCISVCSTFLPPCELCLEFALCVIALTDSFVCVDILPHHTSDIPSSFLTYSSVVGTGQIKLIYRVIIESHDLNCSIAFHRGLLPIPHRQVLS